MVYFLHGVTVIIAFFNTNNHWTLWIHQQYRSLRYYTFIIICVFLFALFGKLVKYAHTFMSTSDYPSCFKHNRENVHFWSGLIFTLFESKARCMHMVFVLHAYSLGGLQHDSPCTCYISAHPELDYIQGYFQQVISG